MKKIAAAFLLLQLITFTPAVEAAPRLSVPARRMNQRAIRAQRSSSSLKPREVVGCPLDASMESILSSMKNDYLFATEETWPGARSRALSATCGNKTNRAAAFVDRVAREYNDKKTMYIPQKGFTQANASIGVALYDKDGLIIITKVFTQSTAQRSGLLAKDRIVTIDGKSTKGLRTGDVAELLKGLPDSKVNIGVVRKGVEMQFSVPRKYEAFPEVNVSHEQGITIIRMEQMWTTVDLQFRESVVTMLKENPRGIILDLRGNPGGLLSAIGKVVSAFVPKNTAYTVIHSRQGSETLRTEEDMIVPENIPVVVLIDEGTASGGEIVASALQEQRGAKLIGERSLGNTNNIDVFSTLSNGDSVRIVTALFATSKGKSLVEGITPDIAVIPSTTGPDAILERGKMELLRK